MFEVVIFSVNDRVQSLGPFQLRPTFYIDGDVCTVRDGGAEDVAIVPLVNVVSVSIISATSTEPA